jgi:2-methylcitrate dehydratase PrpD
MGDIRGDLPIGKEIAILTRRRMLQGAGAFLGATVIPGSNEVRAAIPLGQESKKAAPAASADVTGRVAVYMVEARDRNLPADVAREAKHRILDTLGAIVSGARLKPGEMAIRFVRAQGGPAESSVVATNILTSALNAALANGMLSHADETDDVELVSHAHPGCSAVPAALAMAEREGRSGMELLRAVVLGYDLGCRFLLALGPESVRAAHRSAEGFGATFCAAGAAASLARLDETGMRYALSYAAQQVSGLWSWTQDSDHVEKAFDFGGMGARNGVTAALMVQAGFTGVPDVLDCEHNVLEALSSEPKPEEMIAGLGSRFFVTETAIKTYPVGYPIQAPLDALLKLRREHGLRAENVERIVVRLPADGAGIVDNSAMPDVNCQHIMALALLDGGVSFASANSRERMTDPQVLALKRRVELVADPKLMDPAAPRSGSVEVTLRDGRTVRQFVRFPPGTKENPLDTEGLNAKARDLMAPVLGAQRTEALIQHVNVLEDLRDVRELRPYLTA